MIKQPRDQMHKLFFHEVNALYTLLAKSDRDNYDSLKMAALLRQLVLDQGGLASRIVNDFQTPLIVLVPEPKSRESSSDKAIQVPDSVLRYAVEISDREFPFGTEAYHHKPYRIQEYLGSVDCVLNARIVTPREIITMLANKMGGVHFDESVSDNTKIDGEQLLQINEHFILFGEKALLNRLPGVAAYLWRALAPLRDEILEFYGHDIAI